MAPRHIPRASRTNVRGARPMRSRYEQELCGAEGSMTTEVPFYSSGPVPKTVAAARRLKMILKSGCTSYGLPVGMSGTIVYPLSQNENELLNSMGTNVEVDVAGVGMEDGNADIIGAWMIGLMMQ